MKEWRVQPGKQPGEHVGRGRSVARVLSHPINLTRIRILDVGLRPLSS